MKESSSLSSSGPLWVALSTAVTVVGVVVASITLLLKPKASSVTGASSSRPKKKRTGRCPFTAETDFVVETADHLSPTPLDLFAEWSQAEDAIPADVAAVSSTAPHYRPLAARWLNAGISGQDTPGHLRAGLKRLKDQTWFLVEDPGPRFVHELGLKRKNLDAADTRGTFVQEEDSIAAQAEVLELFCHYLPKRYPQYYEYKNDTEQGGPRITVKPLQETFLLSDYQDKPLELCARIVQEDLVLLRPPRRDGSDASSAFHMSAAAVAFSFAGLAEKLGKPIEFLHAPVPGFEEQLRKTMNLFFNKMLKIEQPLWRNNWLVTPASKGQLDAPNYGTEEATAGRQLKDGTTASPLTRDEINRMFLKVEYQTIRRLPRSGNLLFTIRTMVDHLRELEKVPDAAACLAKSIRGMSPAMRAYKGIGNGQDATYEAVLQYLDDIAAGKA